MLFVIETYAPIIIKQSLKISLSFNAFIIIDFFIWTIKKSLLVS